MSVRLTSKAKVPVFPALVVLLGIGLSDPSLAAGDSPTAYLRLDREEPVILGQPQYRDSLLDFALFRGTQEHYVTLPSVLRATLRHRKVAELSSVREANRKNDAEKWLAGTVKISFPGKAQIMAVTCALPDRREAAVLTNALVDCYLEEYENATRQARLDRIRVLEKIASQKETDLRNKYHELRKLTALMDDAKKANKPAPGDEMLQFDVKTLEELVRELRRELEHAKIELKAPFRVVLIQRADTT